MRIETIPFKVFMAPSPGILSAVDGGLTFFLGLGLTLIVLIVLERFGVTLNEKVLRFIAYGGITFGFAMLCVKMVLLFG